MEWTLKTIAIVTAIFFAGYIIGLVEAAIKQRLKDKKQQQQSDKVEIPSPVASEKPPLLSLEKDENNMILVKMDGDVIPELKGMSNDQKKDLVKLLKDLRPYLEVEMVKETPASLPETPVSQPEKSVKPQAEVPAPEKPTVKPKKTGPLSFPVPERPPESIVSQIDTILQARLAGTPLAGKGIRLQESATGGVIVYIGLQKFDGIEAVTDLQVKTAIQQAIKEWEDCH